MIVRTCLLVTDDPDDHVEFSEALYEVSTDTVLVTISDFNKALELLAGRRCTPDFLVVNTGIAGFLPERLFQAVDQSDPSNNVKVVLWGEAGPSSPHVYVVAHLEADLSFSRLKESLMRIISS